MCFGLMDVGDQRLVLGCLLSEWVECVGHTYICDGQQLLCVMVVWSSGASSCYYY
jgi:hypothetical protein